MKEQDLREKFEDIQKMTFHNHLTVKTSTDQCIQIAETHAKDEAIGFAEWLIIKCDYQKHGVWCYQGMEFSQPELYEIYQQQKQKL